MAVQGRAVHQSSGMDYLIVCYCVCAVKKSIEVLELADIEREYILVHARLQLLQQDPDPAHMAGKCVKSLRSCATRLSRYVAV